MNSDANKNLYFEYEAPSGEVYQILKRLGWAEWQLVDDLKGEPVFIFDGKAIKSMDMLQDVMQGNVTEMPGFIRVAVECDTVKLTMAQLRSHVPDIPNNRYKKIPVEDIVMLQQIFETFEAEQEKELEELKAGNPITIA